MEIIRNPLFLSDWQFNLCLFVIAFLCAAPLALLTYCLCKLNSMLSLQEEEREREMSSNGNN